MYSEKIFVLGIDGLPYDVVASLEKEKFPAFGRILREGCHGVLTSTVPPFSPVAWTSMVTGKNPGKHGVFGFSHVSKGIVAPSFAWVGNYNPVWDVISIAEKRVVVLNVPFTYPPYKVNGVMVSGFPSPMNRVESFPPNFVDRLKLEIGNYEVGVSVKNENYEGMQETDFLREVYRITDIRAQTTLQIMEKQEWDFFFVVFTTLDRIQHVFYGYYDEKSPLYDPEKRKILLEYYAKLDEIVSDILSMIDENTYFMIVSDHGFDYLSKYVGLNNLLAHGKFLGSGSKYLNREKLKSLWRSSGLFRGARSTLPTKLINALQAIIPSRGDYSNSDGYCDYLSTITLRNDLSPESKEKIQRKIMKYLGSVIDPETNQKVVEEIFTTEDILSESPEGTPDIFILFRRGYEAKRWTDEILQSARTSLSPGRTTKTGAHSSSYAQRGFFSIMGRSVKKNFQSTANIPDITPTILHILGIPIPSDIDGKVLNQIFSENSAIAKREIKYVTPSAEDSREQYTYSIEEKESIRDKLEKLGYF